MVSKFYLALFSILTLVGVIHGFTKVPHRDCHSPALIHLTRLDVIPCEGDICVLTRGENVTVIADFVPHIYSSKLFIEVYQQDFNFPQFFETVLLTKYEVCDKFRVECPAVAFVGQQTVFRLTLPKSMPAMKLWFKLIAIGDDNRRLFCISVPLEIR